MTESTPDCAALYAQRFGSRAIVRRASHEQRSTARIIGTVFQ